MGIYHDSDLTPAETKQVAKDLSVSEEDVIEMNRRVSKDSSLNKVISEDNTEGVNMLVSDAPNSEEIMANEEIKKLRTKMLKEAMNSLNPREQLIISRRRLTEEPATLDDLSIELKISKERVRQIENRAMEKLSLSLLKSKNKLLGNNN